MALTAVTDLPFPYMLDGNSFSTNTIDAAGEKHAVVFRAPKTGTIDRLCILTSTCTGTPVCDIRLETVGTDGAPSGTLASTNSNLSGQTLTTDTFHEFTLTATHAATKGDLLAIVVVLSSGTSALLRRLSLGDSSWQQQLHTAHYTASWSLQSTPAVGAVRYDDGTYPQICGLYPFTAVTASGSAHGTGTTPDEVGTKFVPTFDCTVTGAFGNCFNFATGDDYDLVLYDSASSVLASASCTSPNGASTAQQMMWFNTTVDLAAGSTYRIVVKPTTANTIHHPQWTVNSSAAAARPGSEWGCWMTSRTDAGAWTDSSTTWCSTGVIISKLDDGAGGGASSYAFAG